MTDDARSAALAGAIDDLSWCVQIPHTIDQVIGIHAERLGGRLAFRHGSTPDEMAAAITRRLDATGGHGKGGHSDPTFDAAFGHTPPAVDDADETLRSIDVAIDDLDDASKALSLACCPGLALMAASDPTRTARLAVVVSRLERARMAIDATAATRDGEALLDELLRIRIAETAAWLRTKAEGIWRASKGDTLRPAVQVTRKTCEVCTPLGRDVVPERGDRCERCKGFIREHRGLRPTAKIARWWEEHPRLAAPPRLVDEARFEQAEAKRAERAERRRANA